MAVALCLAAGAPGDAPMDRLAWGQAQSLDVETTARWLAELPPDQFASIAIGATGPLRFSATSPSGVPVTVNVEPGAELAEVVRIVADAPGVWILEVAVEQPCRLDIRLDVGPATTTDRLRWRAKYDFARAVHHIGHDQVAVARKAARDAVDVLAQAETDSLALALFSEDLGVEFANARSDSMRALGEEFLRYTLDLRSRITGDRSFLVADTQNTLSSYYYILGRFESAADLQERCVETLRSIPGVSDSTIAYSQNDLGLIYYQVGRYEDARRCLDEALVRYEAVEGARFAVADIHNSLGEVHRLLGDTRAAQASFERAQSQAQALLDDLEGSEEGDEVERFVAIVWLNAAGLLYDDSRYDEAEVLYRRAAAVWQEKGSRDPINLPAALMNLADICRIQGRFSEALDLFVQALDTARRELGAGHPDVFWSQNYLAQLLVEMGRYEAAEENYLECLALLENAGEPGIARLGTPLRGLGDLYAARGEFSRAAEFYRRSAETFRATQGPSSVEGSRSTLAEASARFRQDPVEGKEQARALLEQVRPVLTAQASYPELQIEASQLEAEVLHADGSTQRAIEVLSAALAHVESIRRSSSLDDRGRAGFFADYANAYRQLVRWRLESGDPEAALETMERFRSRVLLDQMRAAHVDLRAGISPEVLARIDARQQAARATLAEVEQRIRRQEETGDRVPSEILRERDDAMRELRLAQVDLRRTSPVWKRAIENEDEPATVGSIQELLAPGEAMIFYQIGRDHSLVLTVFADGALDGQPLVVEPSQASVLDLQEGVLTQDALRRILTPRQRASAAGARGTLVEQPATVGPVGILDSLEQPPHGVAVPKEHLQALFEILVPQSIRARWDPLDAVVVVPDGLLHRLPFEALVVDDAGRYWLEGGPVVRYAPSATVSWVQEQRRRQRSPHSWSSELVSVSDPDFTGPAAMAAATRGSRVGRLHSLPGTAVEAKNVIGHFDSGRVVALQGADATELRVTQRLAHARMLHFATHGLVQNRRDDVFAALALTPGDVEVHASRDDGFLELSEIYELRLEAEIAVLSACATHVGDWIEGDGVFALSRGFLAAGCDRVVGSLWLVDDASTAALMGSFFARLTTDAARRSDPARALRDARLTLLQSDAWAHPYYWAPFIQVGLR